MPFFGGYVSSLEGIFPKVPLQKNSTKTWVFLTVPKKKIDLRISYPDCERCPRGFATVFAASLTLFSQIVAGDQWSSISVPLAEARFSSWTTWRFFKRRVFVPFLLVGLVPRKLQHTPKNREHLEAIPLANHERNHYYSLLVEVEGCVPKVC